MSEDNKNLDTTAESAGGVYTHTQVAEQKGKNIYEHVFKKPFTYEGKTYEKLTFDFEHLTGRDIINADAEMAANGRYALSPEISRDFQEKLAARAAGIGSDAIEAMNAADFLKITNFARNFLLDMGF